MTRSTIGGEKNSASAYFFLQVVRIRRSMQNGCAEAVSCRHRNRNGGGGGVALAEGPPAMAMSAISGWTLDDNVCRSKPESCRARPRDWIYASTSRPSCE